MHRLLLSQPGLRSPHPLYRIGLPGLLFSAALLAGCPSSPPAGKAVGGTGVQNKTSTKKEMEEYSKLLDEAPPPPKLPAEHLAAREKVVAQYRLRGDVSRKPIVEATQLLEAAIAKDPKDPFLPPMRLTLLTRMMNDDFLDDDLAQARIRLGEAMLGPDLASSAAPWSAMELVVSGYDHLGESAKADALLERAAKAMSEPPGEPPAAGDGRPMVIHLPIPPATTTSAAAPAAPAAAGSPPAGQSPPGPLSAAQRTAGAAAWQKRQLHSIRRLQFERRARRDYAAADAMLAKDCQEAWDKSAAEPDALPPLREWITRCHIRSEIAGATRHFDVVQQIAAELASTTQKLAESHPESAEHFALWMQARLTAAGSIIDQDPAGASERLAGIREEIQRSKFAAAPPLANIERSFKGYEFQIKESQFRKDLIGKPAPPFDAERWVHGAPLPLESLRGKVVLLEFWTATRRASIDSFPRLNALHEEFHDKGLEIVGVTRASALTWDPVRKRTEINHPNGTVDTEAPVLEALTEHHQLRFPTFIVPQKTTFYEACGVRHQPHSIVIDREGKIRLTQRVPDEAGHRTIQETIKSLL